MFNTFPLNLLAKRFVAGETAESAIKAARGANEKGIRAILDFLGEDVFTEKGARDAADEYLRLLDLIHDSGVRAAVSLKVSQMGMRVSPEVCAGNLRRVIEKAARLNLFVWFDMEGSALTQKTIDVFALLNREFAPMGLCLQAYLVRTGADVDHLARSPRPAGGPLSVRLCKGAYKEPAAIAYTTRTALEGNFRMLIQKVLDQAGRGIYPAFATHDPMFIDYVVAQAHEKSVSPEAFEFQMLYGIQNQLLASLVKRNFRGSVYIPYGTHWLPYFVRRLRERKENLYFLIRNLFRA